LAAQDDDAELKGRFEKLAKELAANESKVIDELNAVQGKPMDIGGYYYPNVEKASAAMRPSETFNSLLTGA
jgi:isocitrate dehydrogenase